MNDTIKDIIRNRRTVHDFKPELPPRELVLEAIDLARWAPNHKMTEPWHFYLLGPETADAICELNADIVRAGKGEAAAAEKLARWKSVPGWLLVTCENSQDAVRAKEDYAACCCAIQNLQLALWSAGVGVKWTTGKVSRDPKFYEIAWIDPERETVVGLLWYGYPAEVGQTVRKPVAEVLVELP
ncbi:MAG: nitroreductase [Gammaproteobacteria bacterium]